MEKGFFAYFDPEIQLNLNLGEMYSLILKYNVYSPKSQNGLISDQNLMIYSSFGCFSQNHSIFI